MRWRERDGGRLLKGAFMPRLENEFVDTSRLGLSVDLGSNWLREMLPAEGEELAARGDLILEFVVEEPERPETLVPLLEICAPMAAESIADYAMLKNPVPVMTETRGQGTAVKSLCMRAVEIPQIALEHRLTRSPFPVVRPARVFHTDSFLLLIWRGMGITSYLLEPRSARDTHSPPREFPGPITAPTWSEEEIERGVPEKQARFAVEWGGRGPAHFGTVLPMFDHHGGFRPREVAEAWLAAVAEEMQLIAGEELPLMHERWELDLQGELAGSAGGGDHLRSLAMVGALASVVDECHEILSPLDPHDPRWFAKTPHSPRIERALAETGRMLDRFSVRHRDLISLASATSSAMALRLQQQNQRQSENLQAAVTTITSVVAGPALVFGVFGANVPLPLGGSWWGFGLMVFLAVFSAFAIRWVLNRLIESGVQRPLP